MDGKPRCARRASPIAVKFHLAYSQSNRRRRRRNHRRPYGFFFTRRPIPRSIMTSATPSTFGGDLTLPWRSYASTNIYYGSGFSNAFPGDPYPGNYLPPHTTFDLTLGKDFGERFSASLNALNVANRRVELDNSITFGGFHWNSPPGRSLSNCATVFTISRERKL